MTADDRLNQLEPLLSEAMTILDRHTLQLKQLSGAVGQLSSAVLQQGENISFLLREQVEIKNELYGVKTNLGVVRNQLAEVVSEQLGMKAFQDEVKIQQLGIRALQDEMKGQQLDMKAQQDRMDGKLDQLLQLIQK